MIIGAQKCGTSALAHFLGQHPQIRMSSEKEPHLFDAEDYSPHWTAEQIDEKYRRYFTAASNGTPTFGSPTFGSNGTPTFEAPTFEATAERGTPTIAEKGTPTIGAKPEEEGTPTLDGTPTDGVMRGEATPIYLFLPEIAPELRRYNPNLKVIVLLRDPVERAISHYYMERNKGHEQRPLWLALLCESWRLRRCGNPRRHGSAWRRHAYRRRGLFSLQLRNLFQHFDTEQVALVRAEHLARRHDAVLKQMFRFLGVKEYAGIERQTVFEGERGGRRHAMTSVLLRLSYLPESIRMRRFNAVPAPE